MFVGSGFGSLHVQITWRRTIVPGIEEPNYIEKLVLRVRLKMGKNLKLITCSN